MIVCNVAYTIAILKSISNPPLLTYNLSIKAENGRVLSDRGASGHQTDSLPGRLGFDLGYDDVRAREILQLTPTLSYV